MKKIVQRSIIWSVTVACLLLGNAAVKAADLGTIMNILGTAAPSPASNGQFQDRQNTFVQVSNQVFETKAGTIAKVNVIESTIDTSFGIVKTGSSTNDFYTFQRTNKAANNPGNFAVLADVPVNNSTSKYSNYGDADAKNTAGFTANAAQRTAPVVVGSSTGVNQDLANKKIGTQVEAGGNSSTGAPVSTLIGLKGTAGSTFQFVLKTNASITNTVGNQTGQVVSFGTNSYLSSDATFSAYEITSGADKGAFLIAFQNLDPNKGEVFTFAAIVYGVVNPEPASIAMLGTGVLGLVGYWRRRRNVANAAV